eukprot:1778628-Rhodomonas_salina.4
MCLSLWWPDLGLLGLFLSLGRISRRLFSLLRCRGRGRLWHVTARVRSAAGVTWGEKREGRREREGEEGRGREREGGMKGSSLSLVIRTHLPPFPLSRSLRTIR